MRRLIFALCAAWLALTAGTAMAADITGKWTTEMRRPDGGEGFTISYDFKQDGTKLTGTVQGPMGDPMTIADGKVEGDKLSFTVSFEGPDGAMKISNSGTIAGEEITLTTKFEGGGFPGGDRPPAVLKRVK
jgi:hypothetical protein